METVNQATKRFIMNTFSKMEKPKRILALPEVLKIVPASRSTLWRWEKEGLFPKRRRFGLRSVGWDSQEIEKWVSKQMKSR